MNTLLQILIPLIFVLAPVIGQIIKKVNEHAEQRRIEMERERLRDEQLRTGRGEGGEQRRPVVVRTTASQSQGGAAARTNLEEIARRRQAQLEELRRRQQAARGQAPVRAQPQMRMPGPPPVPQQAPPQVPQQMPRPDVRPVPRPQARPVRQQPVRSQPMRSARAEVPRVRPQVRAVPVPAANQPGALSERLRASEVVKAPVKVASLPTGIQAWRQAIMMSEILAPPVSMRRDHF